MTNLAGFLLLKKRQVDGVRSGKYYAAIVIPEDFSDSLLSVLSGTLETPELNYYINEKVNAIAPKSQIPEQVRSRLRSTIRFHLLPLNLYQKC